MTTRTIMFPELMEALDPLASDVEVGIDGLGEAAFFKLVSRCLELGFPVEATKHGAEVRFPGAGDVLVLHGPASWAEGATAGLAGGLALHPEEIRTHGPATPMSLAADLAGVATVIPGDEGRRWLWVTLAYDDDADLEVAVERCRLLGLEPELRLDEGVYASTGGAFDLNFPEGRVRRLRLRGPAIRRIPASPTS